MAERTVHQQDALIWLGERSVLSGCSIVTSLPDISEWNALSIADWKRWFQSAVALVLSRCPADGVCIFYQTDIKFNGVWIDKGFLCQQIADEQQVPLIFHKIVCRVPAGRVTFGRPSYSHLLCFSRGVRADVEKFSADVIPDAGAVTWTRGMGVEACRVACRFILSHTTTRTVVDPFCGHGSVLAVANALGLDAIGVELGPKRAKKARTLQMHHFETAVTQRLTTSAPPK